MSGTNSRSSTATRDARVGSDEKKTPNSLQACRVYAQAAAASDTGDGRVDEILKLRETIVI